ncbi:MULTISPECIES: RNA polymerase sigma-70 factor [unclassified Microbacterium]|uniref:RNA polymerase sigma-70 factor n=1 Tax=unclassified Microbacterium TaxID=2609290 RepID=UPI00214D0A8D|nr:MULTISPECIES: RNA polymerase sigma-70 factor [unclassified Microbacterium]MCR2785541.1 RNA polymerase sigma-70 factor [Microbacterium sp. zg.B96]MDL5350335.1 RNA polymerase sigma-70 factor [Microbacterium sp. zg-YB36]WIM17471.1 RNA polymerase sigma-70 factor [Microbacterium sp. zg-B96]
MIGAERFEELRPLLFSIAYRILGSVGAAEDVVQEAWLRADASDSRPESPKAFLATVVTRLSINELRSARARREQYVGAWFPEPLLEDPYQDPDRAVELAESVSTAALLLLERLSPLERAVFVLQDVFGFGFAEIAAMVERSEAACRQLAVRARHHMAEGRPRFDADPREHERLATRFFAALKDGDVAGLRELLAADVEMASDSGGKAPSLPRTIVGADKVAKLLVSVLPQLTQIGLTQEARSFNGQPGGLFRDSAGMVVSVTMLDIVAGRIQAIRTVTNPQKLAHLGPVVDAWSVHEAYRAATRKPQ